MYYDLPDEPLTIDAADIAQQGTRYKQRAELEHLLLKPAGGSPRRSTLVELKVLLTAYCVAEDGGYGDPLEGRAPRPVFLYADCDTAVYFNPAWVPTAEQPQDPRNGEILSLRGASTPEAWRTELDAKAEPVAIQSRVFRLMMGYPQVLDQLILKEMAYADTVGKFAPVSKPLTLPHGPG